MHRKMNPKSMKEENKRLILKYLIKTGPHTRMEITRHTKLAHSAVWRITDELMQEGFLEEKGESGVRRKAILYGASKSFISSIIFSVEVLETIVGIGFLDGTWKVLKVFNTPKKFEKFATKVQNMLEDIKASYPIDVKKTKVVFSLPGIVNCDEAKLVFAPNLGWSDINFREILGKYAFHILADNDSNLSLLAESFFSEDFKKSDIAFFLYLGEGIGGSIWINGRIIRGKNFAAGEIGHVLLDLSGMKQVEDFLSISNLVNKAEKFENLPGRTLEEKFHRLEELWYLNNGKIKSLLNDFTHCLAIVLRNILYFLNPGVIILGGIVNNIWEKFGTFIQEDLEKITEPHILRKVTIRDTIYKNIPPSFPGCNVKAIESILNNMRA